MGFWPSFEKYQRFNFREAFTAHKEVKLGDKGTAWAIGLFVDEAEGKELKLAAGKSKRGVPILLWPTLLDDDGKIIGHELRAIWGSRLQPIDGSDLPPTLIDNLLETAQKYQANGIAKTASAEEQEHGTFRNVHSKWLDGMRTMFQVLSYKTGDLAGIELLNRRGKQSFYQLNVQKVNESGRIVEAVLQQDIKGKWETIPEEKLPAEIINELYQFAHDRQLFGAAKKEFSEQVEKIGDEIILHHDLDGELASLLSQHYDAKLTEALDSKDKSAFAEVAPMAQAYKEAASALNKPKHHAERIAFERKQAEAQKKSGTAR